MMRLMIADIACAKTETETSLLEFLRRWICHNFHRSITRPVRGEYICLRCMRRYPTDF